MLSKEALKSEIAKMVGISHMQKSKPTLASKPADFDFVTEAEENVSSNIVLLSHGRQLKDMVRVSGLKRVQEIRICKEIEALRACRLKWKEDVHDDMLRLKEEVVALRKQLEGAVQARNETETAKDSCKIECLELRKKLNRARNLSDTKVSTLKQKHELELEAIKKEKEQWKKKIIEDAQTRMTDQLRKTRESLRKRHETCLNESYTKLQEEFAEKQREFAERSRMLEDVASRAEKEAQHAREELSAAHDRVGSLEKRITSAETVGEERVARLMRQVKEQKETILTLEDHISVVERAVKQSERRLEEEREIRNITIQREVEKDRKKRNSQISALEARVRDLINKKDKTIRSLRSDLALFQQRARQSEQLLGDLNHSIRAHATGEPNEVGVVEPISIPMSLPSPPMTVSSAESLPSPSMDNVTDMVSALVRDQEDAVRHAREMLHHDFEVGSPFNESEDMEMDSLLKLPDQNSIEEEEEDYD